MQANLIFGRYLKAAVLAFTALILLLIDGLETVCGQSAFDGFDPNANGSAHVFLIQSDGKILVGGGFTTMMGMPSSRIARLNRDGTLDTNFHASATGPIYAIVQLPNGKLLLGGGFATVGGQPHSGIARIDSITGAVDTFSLDVNSTVYTLVRQQDGKILAGGNFTTIGGQSRTYIARFDSTTGAVDSFNPNAIAGFGRLITSVATQRDGKILVGGSFFGIGGRMNNYIARLDPATGLADSFDPAANGGVETIALQPDGKILVGGTFGSIGGQNRASIARLDPITGLADSFDPHATSIVRTIVVQQDGKILVGGGFFGANSIGGQFRNLIARLDSITGQADSFDPNANMAVCCDAPNVYAFAVQPDGKVLVTGSFIGMAPNGGPQIVRNYIARMEKDGCADKTLVDLNIIGNKTLAVATQPDGKILVGGIFSSMLGVVRNNIARLNTDGLLDMSFDPGADGEVNAIAVEPDGYIMVSGKFNNIGQAPRKYVARIDGVTGGAFSFNGANPNGLVNAMAVQCDGKVLLGGVFTNIGSQNRNHLARLDPMTGLADSFDPNADGAVNAIVLQADGKLLVGGNFNNISGTKRSYLARLDLGTGAADAFAPQIDGAIKSITVQSDGSIVITGDFVHVSGMPRSGMARLNGVNGALDEAFDAQSNDAVESFILQSDGKVLVSGNFNNIGGQPRNYLARLDGTTGLADPYDANANKVVHAIALPADGKVLVGGEFSTVGGQTRNLFARLTNDMPAGQDLSATPTTITWLRSGASPQLSRVTFEYSTDNANYSLLGNGTYASNAWTLSGLNLPNAQNFYIRARGYYRTGENNGSESIAESVRQVFLREVTVANVISRKMHGATAFDINLPRTGNPGIECRSGGASGNYQLIFSFSNPITGVGDASLTSGSGSVSSRMIDSNDAHNYIVNLTGISNAQTVNVTLTNVNDSAGNSSSSVSVPMSVLLGDVDGNGIVNATDITQTKANSGQMIDTTNFRDDATASGSVNSSDVALVKSCSGTGLPSGVMRGVPENSTRH